MKKTLIALFVAAFCFSSMAQVLIYDYSVSFKRIDVKQVKTTPRRSSATSSSATSWLTLAPSAKAR